MTKIPPAAQVLIDFKPQHDFFIQNRRLRIRRDGTEAERVLHSRHHPGLGKRHPSGRARREAAEWVNLYSKWRGANRWPALVKVFDLLAERPEVQTSGVKAPEGKALKEFMASGYPLSEGGLKSYIAAGHGDEELWRTLESTLGTLTA